MTDKFLLIRTVLSNSISYSAHPPAAHLEGLPSASARGALQDPVASTARFLSHYVSAINHALQPFSDEAFVPTLHVESHKSHKLYNPGTDSMPTLHVNGSDLIYGLGFPRLNSVQRLRPEEQQRFPGTALHRDSLGSTG